MNKNISFFNFAPKANDIILMDTNILLPLFFPTSFATSNYDYGEIYQKICDVKSTLIITSLQISELINTCVRIDFNFYKESHESANFKKDYRSTEDFSDTMTSILDIIQTDIIPSFTCIDDKFSLVDKSKLLKKGFAYDYNDAVLADLADRECTYFITNDKDFISYNMKCKIVTNNTFLLLQ